MHVGDTQITFVRYIILDVLLIQTWPERATVVLAEQIYANQSDEINNLCNIPQANQMLVELLIPEPQSRKEAMVEKWVLTEEEGVWRGSYLLSISRHHPKVILGLDQQD